MSKASILSCAAAILVSLPGSIGFAEPATQPASSMALTVMDRVTGEPLEKVKIEISRDGGRDSRLVTDSNGRVIVPLPDKAGGYFFASAKVEGYAARVLEWRPGDKDPIPSSYVLKLDQSIPIRGKVVDDAGEPIEGAHVVVTIRNPKSPDGTTPHERSYVSYENVKTAADGAWTFENAPPDFDKVELGVWDYHHASGEFFQFKDFARAQARDGSITLTLPRGVPIEGVVIGKDDKPLKGAKVMYGGEMASNKMDPQKTDEQGRFAYAAKPGEAVVLTVTAKDHAPELISFTMPSDKKEVTINLSEAKTMFGRIVGPDDEPVPNAWVFPDTWRGSRSLETRIRADKDGKFKWTNAPADAVKCDIDGQAAGYVREEMNLTASDEEIVIHLRKALHVTGTVVDDETGQPIDVFRVVPGIQWNGRQQISWQRERVQNKSRQGKIDYLESWSYPGFAIRIEADGYMPDERRGFTLDDHEVNFEFKLKKAANLVVTVNKPDGKPAAKARAYIVSIGQNLQIGNGTEVYHPPGAEATADESGKLSFPPQNEAFALVIISDDGFARTDQSALDESKTVTLQGWGRLEGTFTLGDKPAADESVMLDIGSPDIRINRNQPQVMHNYNAKTDAKGKFVFEHVPPGDVWVSRRQDVPFRDRMFTLKKTLTQSATVTAGETTKVSLEGPEEAK